MILDSWFAYSTSRHSLEELDTHNESIDKEEQVGDLRHELSSRYLDQRLCHLGIPAHPATPEYTYLHDCLPRRVANGRKVKHKRHIADK